MNQRLFQDAAGTTPAIIAGQPVGLIKRLAGSVDAVQATALSKPTLARHPRTGVRNLAMGAQAYTNSSYWISNGIVSGITRVLIGVYEEGGIRFARYSYSGTCTTSGLVAANSAAGNMDVKAGIAVGNTYFTSARMRLPFGFGPLKETEGLRIDLSERSSENTNNGNATSAVNRSIEWIINSTARSVVNASSILMRSQVGLRLDAGTVLDNLIVDMAELQTELGDARSALQNNYGPNDITEQGVADLWHLYNDGGDSLNATLPAGTYGLASIDINRAITVTTITSDGTTPINTLRHERQLDVILRDGAFSAGEETAIRDYWGRVFA